MKEREGVDLISCVGIWGKKKKKKVLSFNAQTQLSIITFLQSSNPFHDLQDIEENTENNNKQMENAKKDSKITEEI